MDPTFKVNKLLINDHIKDVINDVDIDIEHLLLKKNLEENKNTTKINELTNTRQIILEHIKSYEDKLIKAFLSSQINNNEIKNMTTVFNDFCFYLNHTTLNNFLNGEKLNGLLVFTDLHHSKEDIELLKKTLTMVDQFEKKGILKMYDILVTDLLIADEIINSLNNEHNILRINKRYYEDLKEIELDFHSRRELNGISSFNFKHLSNLEKLTMILNRTIKPCTFCTNLSYLKLEIPNLYSIDKTMLKYKTLKILILSNSDIEILEAGAFEHLLSLETLDLSNNKINRINNKLFENCISLKSINLLNNNIREIKEQSLVGLSNLEELILSVDTSSYESYERFRADSFKELINLRILKLDFRCFDYETFKYRESNCRISKDLFDDLKKLEEFYTTGFFDEFEFPSAFQKLKKLEIFLKDTRYLNKILYDYTSLENLCIKYNSSKYHGIQYCFDIEIKGSPKLKKFTAKNNGYFANYSLFCIKQDMDIKKDFMYADWDNNFGFMDNTLDFSIIQSFTMNHFRIDGNIFNYLDNIMELDLSRSTFARGSLKGMFLLNNLERLDLRSCSLNTLDEFVFENLINLKWLNLNNNRLKSLEINLFEKLGKLEYLNLSCNPIEEINEEALVGLFSLKYLDVDRCEIRDIYEKSFKDLVKLETIILSNNRLITVRNIFSYQTALKRIVLINNLFLNDINIENLATSIQDGATIEIDLNKILDIRDIKAFKYLINNKRVTLKDFSCNVLLKNIETASKNLIQS